jgi:hypothetical protein
MTSELERRLNQIADFKLPISVSKGYNIPPEHDVLGYHESNPEVLVEGEAIDKNVIKLKGIINITDYPGINCDHPIYEIIKKEFPNTHITDGFGNIKSELHMIYDTKNDLTYFFAVPHREYSEKKKE